jgi:hypothetical protein
MLLFVANPPASRSNTLSWSFEISAGESTKRFTQGLPAISDEVLECHVVPTQPDILGGSMTEVVSQPAVWGYVILG